MVSLNLSLRLPAREIQEAFEWRSRPNVFKLELPCYTMGKLRTDPTLKAEVIVFFLPISSPSLPWNQSTAAFPSLLLFSWPANAYPEPLYNRATSWVWRRWFWLRFLSQVSSCSAYRTENLFVFWWSQQIWKAHGAQSYHAVICQVWSLGNPHNHLAPPSIHPAVSDNPGTPAS